MTASEKRQAIYTAAIRLMTKQLTNPIYATPVQVSEAVTAAARVWNEVEAQTEGDPAETT